MMRSLILEFHSCLYHVVSLLLVGPQKRYVKPDGWWMFVLHGFGGWNADCGNLISRHITGW